MTALAIVQEIGPAAGLAAIVGLVVLSTVYVSHAREVKRLREWAGRTPQGSGRGVYLAAVGPLCARRQMQREHRPCEDVQKRSPSTHRPPLAARSALALPMVGCK